MNEIDVLDLAGRATHAAQGWARGCEVGGRTPLEGGTVGLVFVGDVHGGPPQHRRVVLKVAPPGLPPVRNRDMRHDIVRVRSFAAVEMCAALHRVYPADVGLGDEPSTTSVGEVDRWTQTLDTVSDDFRIGYERAGDALRSTAPAPARPPMTSSGSTRSPATRTARRWR